MPTLILFKDGKVAAQHVGALVQKKKIEDFINGSITA
jgi:thioredoxin 1